MFCIVRYLVLKAAFGWMLLGKQNSFSAAYSPSIALVALYLQRTEAILQNIFTLSIPKLPLPYLHLLFAFLLRLQ